MANTTNWIAGTLAASLTSAMTSTELNSLANGSSVMTTLDIDNSTDQDMYADVAIEVTIASSTLAAGAQLSLYLYDKFSIDGTNTYYGDNALGTGGSAKTFLPNYGLVQVFSPSIIAAAQTVVMGIFRGIVLPPRAFRFAIGNSLGVTLAASGHTLKYQTYNINLNA